MATLQAPTCPRKCLFREPVFRHILNRADMLQPPIPSPDPVGLRAQYLIEPLASATGSRTHGR